MKKSLVVDPDQMPDWLKKRANMTHELEKQLLRGLIEHGKGLTLFHLQAFLEHRNPFAIDDIRKDWEDFYKRLFNFRIDFTNVAIPNDPRGLKRAIYTPQNLTYTDVVKVLKKKFKVRLYTNKLDGYVVDDRASNQSYMVFVSDKVEADPDLACIWASRLKERNRNCITLMERLIYELKYFDETGEHLDVENITLCAGSRYFDGSVPAVRWHGDQLRVSYESDGVSGGCLRARKVVSA
jgi:hypothetical protein